jgi:hypothetical protein
MKHHISATAIALTGLTFFALSDPARAGEQVPFQGALEGALVSRVPNPAPPVFDDRIEMTGEATQLGQFELVIEATVDFGNPPPIAMGTATFTAANGDTLVADVIGTSVPVVPGVSVLITEDAVIDPDGSTGRFAGATGSFTIERLFNLTTFETVGSFDGTISPPGR